MDNMRTMWRQHGVNMGTTGMCRPHGDMGSDHVTKNLINLKLIKIIQICLKIFDLLRHPHLWVGGWISGLMDGSMGGSMGGTRSNH